MNLIFLSLHLQKQKITNSFPSELGLVKRFWRYLLEHEVECPLKHDMLLVLLVGYFFCGGGGD